MKVNKKELRKLQIEDKSFLYVVNEDPSKDKVKIRVYSSKYKSTYFEVYFDWKENWSVNLHKPSVCNALINYFIAEGWQPEQKNSVLSIKDGGYLIELLKLELLSVSENS
ncbi:hypothetical protein [Aquibacillus albus]|uniref:Uncharacterized protein n=1 Tax=Aquibacillus albus TaxID=1168171 RepID=A0ABS2MVK7_9BACI|nr:hypothetical protein [Aquibacillus albus]MBM7569936.1 hypothetical protein [Aquibacillus albus]